MAEGLAREAEVFARYLSGAGPTAYVAQRYTAGQQALPASRSTLDAALLVVARAHPVLARVADAYGRIFAPRSLLRHKLVLMLAVLESSSPTSRSFDPLSGGLPFVLARGTAAAAGFAAALALGVLVIGPLHLGILLGGRK